MPPLAVSPKCESILRLLATHRNVLLQGVPAAGKTRLLQEVREAFESVAHSLPGFTPGSRVTVPATAIMPEWVPSPGRSDRLVLSMTMAPSTRYRHLLRDLEVSPGAGSAVTYRISEGLLHRANQFAITDRGAALLIVDELNRGPAVEVFGPALAALEANKRAGDDDVPVPGKTAFFQLADDTGALQNAFLSPHVYVLAAMNRADISAEALDSAFLRRFQYFELLPDESVLRESFGLPSLDSRTLPATTTNPADVLEAAVRALSAVNERLRFGAGEDMQIGHGILLAQSVEGLDITHTKRVIREQWNLVERHVREVFFGNDAATAEVLGVRPGGAHPYFLESTRFSDQEAVRLVRPVGADTYSLLLAIAT